MGKTLEQALAEIDKSAWACSSYAEHAEDHLSPQPVETEWTDTHVQHEPLGVLLAVMSWNYPIWQVMRAAAPALMAGNTVVLKHASNVVGCARLLARLIARAAPDPLPLELVVAPGSAVAGLIADPRIAAVTFTGSDGAGAAVAAVCAKHLKKSVLEPGGSDPFIVLEDADVAAAAAAGVTGHFLNAGQSCIAAKRFIVVESAADAFEETLGAGASALQMGDQTTDVDPGPMARVDLRDELAAQVRRGAAEGGSVLVGGKVPDGPGAYYQPTVVRCASPHNPLAREETFGPVAAVLRVADARSRSRTTRASGSARRSGPRTSIARAAWPAASRPGRCS